MVQLPSSEKLHAACDECRTRKLKCSGDKPNCTRCKRENIECFFSPQKQMGRPRKRRREGESDEITISPPEPNNTTIETHDYSMFPDLGFVTPPAFPDSSFPPENETLSHHDLSSSNVFDASPPLATDFNADPPIDPSLWDNNTVYALPPEDPANFTLAPCTCLSLMYLTLTELQSIPSFAFPQVIVPLRKAMNVLSDLINCKRCPKDNFSAIQNISSIVALCKAIVERFNQVLLEIDAEAERLEQNGLKKPYRIGDMNPELQHLHTGTLDCPLGFNIEIEAKDWKRLAKTALKTELYGNGSNPRPLLQLVTDAEERQKRWHENRGYHCAERRHMYGDQHPDDAASKNCEALGADHIRLVVNNLKWE